ncbi:MAG: type II toxin-antitoxin system HicB family antitoxin [Candidatus Atribacteria bacterium]|nr:type II toxin-antitoxin system HicB family antitoxin [Candidatus Atribacteria bacterium]
MRRKELRVSAKPIFVFTGVVIKENEGYSSLCLELDVASQGETIEEANLNLMEAVTLYLETAIESNLPLIRPVLERENPINTRTNDVMKIFKMNIDFQVRAYA